MNFTSPPVVTAGQSRSSNAYPNGAPYALGSKAQTRDGRVFRFCQAGTLALVPGNVIQNAAQITAHQNCAVLAASIGATQVLVTPGAATGAANLYAEGMAIVSTGPDLGSAYGVSGHGAIASGTQFTLNLFADDVLQTAFTTATKLDLVANQYKAVIQAPVTTLTGVPVGVAVHAVQPSEYGWLQTWGAGAVLVDGTPAVANLVSSPAAVAGGAAINSTTLAIVGTMMATGVSGRCQAVFITIAP